MSSYTKQGDKGKSKIWNGNELPKDHPRLNAIGAVDELVAHLGVVCSLAGKNKEPPSLLSITDVVKDIQRQLFAVNADLARNPEYRIKEAQTKKLEITIDQWEEELPALAHFILPLGHKATVQLHVTRTVCRRAERAIVCLSHQEDINPEILKFMNRLSDLLFTAARMVNNILGIKEEKWTIDVS